MKLRKVIVAGAGVFGLLVLVGGSASSVVTATVDGERVSCPGGSLSADNGVVRCGDKSGDGTPAARASEETPEELTPAEREAVREALEELEDTLEDLGVRLGG